jgi:hypothetical protein
MKYSLGKLRVVVPKGRVQKVHKTQKQNDRKKIKMELKQLIKNKNYEEYTDD